MVITIGPGEVLASSVSDGDVPGVIALVANRDGVLFADAYGERELGSGVDMTLDTVCWIASMTKMFAGASIMMLVDEGKVSLDDPVTRFIPQLSKWMVVEEKDQSHVLLKPPVRPVTIRHGCGRFSTTYWPSWSRWSRPPIGVAGKLSSPGRFRRTSTERLPNELPDYRG